MLKRQKRSRIPAVAEGTELPRHPHLARICEEGREMHPSSLPLSVVGSKPPMTRLPPTAAETIPATEPVPVRWKLGVAINTTVSGDTCKELIDEAFERARAFFGPDVPLNLDRGFLARDNKDLKHRGKHIATITVYSMVPSDL